MHFLPRLYHTVEVYTTFVSKLIVTKVAWLLTKTLLYFVFDWYITLSRLTSLVTIKLPEVISKPFIYSVL